MISCNGTSCLSLIHCKQIVLTVAKEMGHAVVLKVILVQILGESC